MNLHLLRDETRQEHEATEALLPLTSPDLQRQEYLSVLVCFARVVETWESWAASHATSRLAGLAAERRRGPLLKRDLQFFGLPGDAHGAGNRLPALDTICDQAADESARDAVFLGAMYVMEGSTLGGQFIAKHVEERFGLKAGEGDAFFRGYGDDTGARWNAFRDILRAVPDEATPLVIGAARAMFAYVQESMRGCLPSRAVLAPDHPEQVHSAP